MMSGGLAFVYTLAVLLILLPMLFVVVRRPGALRHFAIWVVILVALMWGYHLFGEPQGMEPPRDTPPAAAPSPVEEPAESPVRNL